MIKKLYYVVINGGDGSASPTFVESRELSQWIEENESEGFTEAEGWITLKSDSPIEIIDNVETHESYFIEHMIDEWSNFTKDQIQNYIETFFSGVRPIFEVRDSDKEGYTSEYGDKITYVYIDIYFDGKLITTDTYDEGTSKERILKELNGK